MKGYSGILLNMVDLNKLLWILKKYSIDIFFTLVLRSSTAVKIYSW